VAFEGVGEDVGAGEHPGEGFEEGRGADEGDRGRIGGGGAAQGEGFDGVWNRVFDGDFDEINGHKLFSQT
jgi:hypothetical protein